MGEVVTFVQRCVANLFIKDKSTKMALFFIRNVNSLRFVFFISFQKEDMIELVVIDMKHYQYHACF